MIRFLSCRQKICQRDGMASFEGLSQFNTDIRGSPGETKENRIEPMCVIAVDFGTTFSGYAFAFFAEKGTICLNNNWGSRIGVGSHKTPTCVLTILDENNRHEFSKFGFEAQETYGSKISGQNTRPMCLFDQFKMKLFDKVSIQIV